MKKPKDPKIFLGHIMESIDRIEKNTDSLSWPEFADSENIQDIAARRLEIIGEAVTNIPDFFRKQYPKIPWKKIAGFRNVLIHEYFDIDINLVWKIIKKDLPKLKKQIAAILKSISSK